MNPLESAETELESLLRQKADIELRVEAVTKSVELLKPFYAVGGKITIGELMIELQNVGITQAVERVLASRPYAPTYPTQVRDLLFESGYEVKGDNPLATVHTILKRLVAKGKVLQGNDASGKIAYEYRDISSMGRYRSGGINPKGLASLPKPSTTTFSNTKADKNG